MSKFSEFRECVFEPPSRLSGGSADAFVEGIYIS